MIICKDSKDKASEAIMKNLDRKKIRDFANRQLHPQSMQVLEDYIKYQIHTSFQVLIDSLYTQEEFETDIGLKK